MLGTILLIREHVLHGRMSCWALALFTILSSRRCVMRSFVKIWVLVVGVALLGVAARASADDTVPSPQSTARVLDLLSLAVYGASNEKLGKIEDIVVDPSSGKIRYAVLSFGGILGIGDKYFAVPWHDMNVVYKGATSAGTQKEEYATIDVLKDALKNAPGFNKGQWPNFADQTFTRDLETFYGFEPGGGQDPRRQSLGPDAHE